MGQRPSVKHEKTDQREHDQASCHAQVSRARKTQGEPGKTGDRDPEQEQFDRHVFPPPNQHAERKKGRSLKHRRERAATGQCAGNKTLVGHCLAAARQAELRSQLRPRMKRRFGRELRHGQRRLDDDQDANCAEHEPAGPIAAQLPRRSEINGQRPEEEPSVIPRGIGIGARRLAPEEETAEEQRCPHAQGRRGAERAPKKHSGNHRGCADQHVAGDGKRGIPPTTKKNLGGDQSRRQQGRREPVERSG